MGGERSGNGRTTPFSILFLKAKSFFSILELNSIKEESMSVAKITEIKASSPKSFDDAIKEGITRCNKTLENVRSAWVKDMEVIVDERGEIAEYRVLMRVSFVLKD